MRGPPLESHSLSSNQAAISQVGPHLQGEEGLNAARPILIVPTCHQVN